MNYKAEIDIMPLEAILDPQGKAVTQSMSNLGLNEITNVRIGKHITLKVEANDEATAKEKVAPEPTLKAFFKVYFSGKTEISSLL